MKPIRRSGTRPPLPSRLRASAIAKARPAHDAASRLDGERVVPARARDGSSRDRAELPFDRPEISGLPEPRWPREPDHRRIEAARVDIRSAGRSARACREEAGDRSGTRGDETRAFGDPGAMRRLRAGSDGQPLRMVDGRAVRLSGRPWADRRTSRTSAASAGLGPQESVMPHRFAAIAFTPAVRKLQESHGSRASYARIESAPDGVGHGLGEVEAAFVAGRDSFYMATVSETGWPCVQHRGGPVGFVRVLDETRIGFADFRGNRHLSASAIRRRSMLCRCSSWTTPKRLVSSCSAEPDSSVQGTRRCRRASRCSAVGRASRAGSS